LTPRDLEPLIGPSDLVVEVLKRKRPRSLRMVKRQPDELKIPYEGLLRCAESAAVLDGQSQATPRLLPFFDGGAEVPTQIQVEPATEDARAIRPDLIVLCRSVG
jgi:hypothetical protein